ncbi:MAG: hypothetical protein ACKOX2_12260 [Microcystaceae cyanobacterium]
MTQLFSSSSLVPPEPKTLYYQMVRCPNCGNHAVRQQIKHLQVTETSCPVCDYLMVNCSQTGNVLEFYAPGLKSVI